MPKIFKIEIDSCFRCPKYDHSGAFTPGGAIPLCYAFSSKKYSKYNARKLPYNSTGRNGKRQATGIIPDWCPLKNC